MWELQALAKRDSTFTVAPEPLAIAITSSSATNGKVQRSYLACEIHLSYSSLFPDDQPEAGEKPTDHDLCIVVYNSGHLLVQHICRPD